jgi:hypothetical protein
MGKLETDKIHNNSKWSNSHEDFQFEIDDEEINGWNGLGETIKAYSAEEAEKILTEMGYTYVGLYY